LVEAEAAKHGHVDVGEYVRALLCDLHRAGAANGPDDKTSSTCAAWEVPLQIGASIPEAEWSKVPPDLAANIDHYLYGAPVEG
jgi:hypothetical protein